MGMRSHGIKIVLAGRILEILYSHTCNKHKRFMNVREICTELRNTEFAPVVNSYLKLAGGIDERQIAWLLTLMAKRARMPFGLFEIPLVTHNGGARRGGSWGLNRTTHETGDGRYR